MKHKQGFTLTEILLAVMVVGIIGVALASLTTAASRESGTGRSRVMLRNNLSVALRQLRQDVHEASRIIYAKGPTSNTDGPLLVLASNVDLDGNALVGTARKYIAYCFTAAGLNETSSGDPVQPEGSAWDGGVIRRVVSGTALIPSNACDTAGKEGKVWLNNVKFIAATSEYPVPWFDFTSYNGSTCREGANEGQCAILDVKLIVELNSLPVVNEAVEERILVSNGGGVID